MRRKRWRLLALVWLRCQVLIFGCFVIFAVAVHLKSRIATLVKLFGIAVLINQGTLDRRLLDYVIRVVDWKALDVVVDDARVAKVTYIH